MSTTTQPASSSYLPVRDDWLARRTEAILEPDLPDRRSAPSSVGASGLGLHARRSAGRHQQRPQHRRHGVRAVPLDAPRGWPGGNEAGRRDRVRQRRGGDERLGRLWPDQGLRGHRGARRSAARFAGARGAGGAYPRRRRAVPRHPPHHRLGRRSDADEPGLRAAARADGGCHVPPGLRLPGAAQPQLRCVAVPSADRRGDRARAGVSRHAHLPEPCRRAAGDRRLCRQARGGSVAVGRRRSAHWRNAPTWWSSLAAWRCASTASTSTRRPIRRRRRHWPRPGSPMWRPASRRSAPRAACSKAIFRWTRDRTPTRRIGMRAKSCRAARVPRRRRICSAARRRGSTGWSCSRRRGRSEPRASPSQDFAIVRKKYRSSTIPGV